MESPLASQTVLIPRPVQAGQDPLGTRLADMGASVVYSPVIQILPPVAWDDLDRALRSIQQYQGAVFLSRHGVQAVVDRAESLGERDGLIDSLGSLGCFTIGQGTAAELERLTGKSSHVPGQSNSQAMADLLIEQRQHAPFLIFRGDRGSRVLPQQLSSGDIPFQQVVAYRSADVEVVDRKTVDRMGQGLIDWVTVTSSAIARSLVRLYGDSLRRTRLASISPTTSGVLDALGYPPDVEAEHYDFNGLVAAMVPSGRD
ncbi:MAG: uroporphyrinogen-III synthase [Mariniblastus sp.]|nr:uroporphyrinogen-III synthase [Mariniblastus sp.]